MFETILVPLDGSVRAESAIPIALDLCRRYSARLLLFQVRTQPHPAAYYAEAMHLEELFRALEKNSQEYLSRQAALLNGRGVLVETEHVEGHPAEAIIDKANSLKNGLIVLASHGRDGMPRWIMGSTAERVARHADCPVMLLRSPQLQSAPPPAENV